MTGSPARIRHKGVVSIHRSSYNQITEELTASIDKLLCTDMHDEWIGVQVDIAMNANKEMPAVFMAEHNGQITGMVYLFAPTTAEIEINAFVHPDHRQQGVFKALLKDALAGSSAFGYKKGLFVVSSGTAAGIMEHWGCAEHHAELKMQCVIGSSAKDDADIRLATMGELAELSALGALIFESEESEESELIKNSISDESRALYVLYKDGKKIGMCGTVREDDGLMIYGFGVRPEMRRAGCGRTMLKFLQREAVSQQLSKLYLEVDENNHAAKALYESFGFTVQKKISYFEFSFDRLLEKLG